MRLPSVCRRKKILLAKRTASKLEKASEELSLLGYNANWKICDTSNRASVKELAEFAACLGTVRNVIHSARLSPAMAKPEQLIRVNALRTAYVNREFANVMSEGSVIVDVSSNSAWLTIFRTAGSLRLFEGGLLSDWKKVPKYTGLSMAC